MASAHLPVSYRDLLDAEKALSGVVHRTPVLTSRQADGLAGARVFFKCESFQRTGSFKFRGAYNAIRLLTEAQRKRGVIAFSSGNHAQAIALAARLLDASATIVMPFDAPAVKISATRDYGAQIRFYDRERENRETIAAQLSEQFGLALIPPYDHRDIIAGQGTAAKELIEEAGSLDYLFVCVGGGGLISGSSIAAVELSPGCRVVGVEPETGNDAQQSFLQGRVVSIPTPDTIADGARTQHIGKLVLPILQANVQTIVTVDDQQLCEQMRFFFDNLKIVVEPTGCLAAAAVLNRKLDIVGVRIGVIVSGGNVDAELFSRCLANSGKRKPSCN